MKDRIAATERMLQELDNKYQGEGHRHEDIQNKVRLAKRDTEELEDKLRRLTL